MAIRPRFGRAIHQFWGALTRAVRQLWDALTVPILAGLLSALALVAVLIYATTNALDAWMPNVATGATSIAITITVVDRLIKRADDARVASRRLQAYRHLLEALVSLTMSVSSDYLATHLHSDIEMSGDPAELLKRWREDDVDTPRRPPPPGARPFVLDAALEFATALRRIAAADHDVLPHDLLATMNEIDERVARNELMDQRLEQAASSGQLIAHYENPDGGRYDWQVRSILEAAERFAAVFRGLLPHDWAEIFNRPVSIPAVPTSEDNLE
jgi:hypothetical protein